jgi:hypothetical protein
VQPFPKTEPNPTRNPAIIIRGAFSETSCKGTAPLAKVQRGAANKRPAKNMMPCINHGLSIEGGRRRDTIPLTPAIRPFEANSITADMPISAPPSNEVKGVKSVSI